MTTMRALPASAQLGAQSRHRHWQRGQYMSPYVRTYVVYDYGRYRLRPPPRGFVWVRADNDYLLVAAATGVVFDVIRGGW
jgi:Ni/Co efflux regulator RcnB